MSEVEIRPVRTADLPRLVEMNNAVVPDVNPLELDAMRRFAETSPWFRIAELDGAPAGFVVVLRPDADYASLNFRWFRDRYADFVYVDRIAVDAAARRRGLARALYDDVGAFALECGAPMICAEINLEPPNPASIDFHRRRGFEQVGTLDHDEGKRVVMMVKRLAR
ncbi:MAG TPA: GNAT family N-acetyltransferase [Thermoanaerobaculia bacterium]|nr:GNAT family N-acetyltransferase [Thermoanaerobaculia bacterium]